MKTAVVVDSGSNYYNEVDRKEGLFAIPLQIIDGDHAYLESVEISIDEVNQKLASGKLLQTSLPSLGKIEELFTEIKEMGYEQILAVPITSGISGTINAMVTAAQFADIKFEYIDCFTAARIELDLALTARDLLDEGKSIEAIRAILDDSIKNSDTYIIPDDLKHLSRGGRLSPLAATLGGFLKIKPILHLNHTTNGVIDPFGKVRTMSKAIDTVIAHMQDVGVGAGYTITIVDVEAPEALETTIEKLKTAFPEAKLHTGPLISTVSVHVGIGSVAFQYMKNPII